MRGQSGTTAGTLAVLAVVVAVAVAGAMVAERREHQPPLEVVVDVPPPAAKPVAAEAEVDPAPVSDPPTGGVAEIVTGSGSDGSGDSSPSPDPVIEPVNPVRSAEALDGPSAAVETSEDPRPRADPGGLAATFAEPPPEARRSSPSTTSAEPIPLGDAVVIARRSNLRAEPGPDADVLAKLETGERAFRLDDAPVQGYYRVYYDGVVGWIWWLNVRDGPGGNIEGCLHCDRPLGNPALATGLENPSG